MFAEIQSGDVYALVLERGSDLKAMRAQLALIFWAVVVLSVLVIILCAALFATMKAFRDFSKRAEKLLSLAEKHGRSTDKSADLMAQSVAVMAKSVTPVVATAATLQAATAEVVAKVEEVPAKVMQAIADSAGINGPGSGVVPIPR